MVLITQFVLLKLSMLPGGKLRITYERELQHTNWVMRIHLRSVAIILA